MATNYTELKAEIQAWLAEETLLATVVDTLIDIVEAELNHDKEFRTREMNVVTDLVVTGEYVALPDDYLSFQYLTEKAEPNNKPLEFVTPENLIAKGTGLGSLRFYTIVNNQVRLRAIPGSSVTLEASYYQKIPALSDQITTNWLLGEMPQIYLYGALSHAEPYLNNEGRLILWKGLYGDARQNYLDADKQARTAAGNLTIQMPEPVV